MTVKQEALAALVGILAHVDHLTIDFKDRVEKEIVHLQAEIDLAPKPVAEAGNVTGSGATAEGIPANTTVDAGNDTNAVVGAGVDVNTTTQTEAEQSAPSASTASTTADASNKTE